MNGCFLRPLRPVGTRDHFNLKKMKLSPFFYLQPLYLVRNGVKTSGATGEDTRHPLLSKWSVPATFLLNSITHISRMIHPSLIIINTTTNHLVELSFNRPPFSSVTKDTVPSHTGPL